MFKRSLFFALLTLSTLSFSDGFAYINRHDDDQHDVLRRYENRGNLDYRTNWEYDKKAYLEGESPFKPSWDRDPNGYYYRGEYYQSEASSNRPYHRGDWNDRKNWRYSDSDQDAYLRGVTDQSDYYRAQYGQGVDQSQGYYQAIPQGKPQPGFDHPNYR